MKGERETVGSHIFVTRNNITVEKEFEPSIHHSGGEEERHLFKDRNIQALLHLDSWMYSLSNPCANTNNAISIK
jgi:hypothetical protein